MAAEVLHYPLPVLLLRHFLPVLLFVLVEFVSVPLLQNCEVFVNEVPVVARREMALDWWAAQRTLAETLCHAFGKICKLVWLKQSQDQKAQLLLCELNQFVVLHSKQILFLLLIRRGRLPALFVAHRSLALRDHKRVVLLVEVVVGFVFFLVLSVVAVGASRGVLRLQPL